MSGGDLKMKPLNSNSQSRDSLMKSNISNNNLLEESKSIMKSSISQKGYHRGEKSLKYQEKLKISNQQGGFVFKVWDRKL
jgi:hypothetical protein